MESISRAKWSSITLRRSLWVGVSCDQPDSFGEFASGDVGPPSTSRDGQDGLTGDCSASVCNRPGKCWTEPSARGSRPRTWDRLMANEYPVAAR